MDLSDSGRCIRHGNRFGAGFMLRLLFSLLSTLPLLACGEDEVTPEVSVSAPNGAVRLTEAQEASAGIVTEVVERRSIQQRVKVPGSVQSPDTVQSRVGAFVEGRVVRVHVLPGDAVQAGQPLVDIHTHELSDALRDLTSAEAETTFRARALERSEELYESGAVSLEEVERRRADHVMAGAELLRAEDIVEHLNPSADGDAMMLAPRSGTVFGVTTRIGEAVVPGTPLMEIGSNEVLWVVAYIPEHTATDVAVGDVVTVSFTEPNIEVEARLVRMGGSVDPSNRSVEARFELSTVPPGVRSGSFAVVDVATSQPFEGAELSEEAAVRIGQDDVVFVSASPGLYEAVPVEVLSIGEGRVVVGGVPNGARVVTRGAYFLKASMELAADEESGP